MTCVYLKRYVCLDADQPNGTSQRDEERTNCSVSKPSS
jgi:hypothetical protein